MRVLLVLCIILLAGLANGDQEEQQSDFQFGYHEVVGFPEAERIKKAEEEYVANNKITSEVLANQRIVGGAITYAHSYPYLAGLLISIVGRTARSVCGATLLSSNRLVTAAHCWFDTRFEASQFEVVLGSQFLFFGGVRVLTNQVHTHPWYNQVTYVNDIAMIYLPWDSKFSAIIQPVALPSGDDLRQNFAGSWAIAAGYGKTSDLQNGVTQITQVSHVNLQVITLEECQRSFGWWVQHSNVCTSGAGGVGICGGDSGGPLVVSQNGRDVVIGISSFVASVGCQRGHPSVFASVISFYDFIQKHLR